MSRVCVAGLGKLGACMAAVLASRGHEVIGFDVSPSTVETINSASVPFIETGLFDLLKVVRSSLSATLSPHEAVRKSDIAFIVVPTPTGADGMFTNAFVLEAVTALAGQLRGQSSFYTVVICSTVMPGSCRGAIRDALEQTSGRTVGVDIGLCYSPEFIALGSVIHDMTHPDMVLLGADDATSRSTAFDVLRTIPDGDPEFVNLTLIDAEIAKIAVNTYVTMKISFANTMGEICSQIVGADAHLVTRAMGHDQRIGPRYLAPGAAYGGPCFPRDTAAFAAFAHQVHVGAELAIATDRVNRRQVLNLAERLKGYDELSVLGIAYKPGTPVTECSFGRELVEILQFEGTIVHSYDPKLTQTINGNHACEDAQTCVNSADVVVVATPEHAFSNLDYKNKIVFDMWGVVDPGAECARLVRFGAG